MFNCTYLHNTTANVTAFAGSDLLLVCNVTGDPPPGIIWFCNDTKMKNETDRELFLSNSQKRINGAYKCAAENLVARLTSSVTTVDIIGN